MNRRFFLLSLAFTAGVATVRRRLGAQTVTDDDELLCTKKFSWAGSLELEKRPIGDVIAEVGKSFIGTPYAPNTLEAPGDEHLVVNLHGLDCVTFYENSLVFARCIKKRATTFDDYRKELQFIRYRGGVMDGYTSRLHYTSDYFYDNEKKGVFRNVTKEIGGVPFVKSLNFMSTHAGSSRQLREHPEFIEVIKQQEADINARAEFYIPKGDVESIADKIQSGDILGITTDVEGLDCSHTGVAIHQDGALHLMHAPDVGYTVTISEKPLAEYLASHKKQSGLMVMRPLEPTTHE